MSEIVLMSDPRVAAVAVRECAAPLMDLRGHDRIRLAERKRDVSGAYAHLRRGVAGRLEEASALLPSGLCLLVVEGYRPARLQQHHFDDYLERLRRDRPRCSARQLRAAASRYVSPPEVAPHPAGAAVDLTLCTDDGDELDLGTAVDATPEESQGRCYTASTEIGAAAARNRQILIAALRAVGLVNYPSEWWHWSFGDRFWAATTGAPAACYGPLTRDPESSLSSSPCRRA